MANNNGMFDEQIIEIKAQVEGFDKARQQIVDLQKSLNDTLKDSDARKGVQTIKEITKALDTAGSQIERLQLAQDLLAESMKATKKARQDLTKALATGSSVDISAAEKAVATASSRQKRVAATIYRSKGIQQMFSANRQVTDLETAKERQEAEQEAERARQEAEQERQSEIADILWKIDHQKELLAIQKEQNRQAQAENSISGLLSPTDKKLEEIEKTRQKLASLIDTYRQIYVASDEASFRQKVNMAVLRAQIVQTNKSLKGLESNTKKSATWFSKLVGRIRNISIYRMIRSAIKWLTSGVQEGLAGLSQYSTEVDESLSNVKNSLGQVRNTLAISFAQTLKALEPIITTLTDALVDLLNAFNLAMSQKTGEPYMKAKKSADLYSESVKKATKLSFDAFEALDSGGTTDTKDLFEQGDAQEDESPLSKIFSHVFDIIEQIYKVVTKVIDVVMKSGILDTVLEAVEFVLSVVSWIVDTLSNSGIFDALSSLLKTILESTKQLVEAFLPMIEPILKPVLKVVKMILNVLGSVIQMVVGLIQMLVAQSQWIGGIFKGIFTGNWDAFNNGTSTFKQGGRNFQKGFSGAFTGMLGFANGGIPDKSELFYMNEYGRPEALVNTGGTQTNVINLDQISQATHQGFVQAIYETGLLDAMQARISIDGANIDDNAFARAIFPALRAESTRRGGNQL